MIAAMTVTGAAALPVQAATNAGNSANCNGKGYYVLPEEKSVILRISRAD